MTFAQIESVNQLPINQAAATFLRKTDWGINPASPHVLTLMRWGLENGLTSAQMGTEPADWLQRLAARRGAESLMQLVTGAQADEVNLDAADLLTEPTPLEAAQRLLENLLLNYKAGL